jgi:hypothetical protein
MGREREINQVAGDGLGFTELRPGQREAVEAVVQGRTRWR